jgi:hypothetical protein
MAVPLVFMTLASLLVACGGVSGANHPAALTTPAPTATSRILYQTDWTNGASDWKLPKGWTITPDGLNNNGHNATSAIIPYTPTVANYSIEIVMQVNAVVGPSACGNVFGLESRTTSNAIVYDALISCITPQYHGFAEIYASNSDGGGATYDYTTGTSSRVYDINIEGQYVSYTYSGSFLGMVHCKQPTSPNQLELVNAGVATTITRITITTP